MSRTKTKRKTLSNDKVKAGFISQVHSYYFEVEFIHTVVVFRDCSVAFCGYLSDSKHAETRTQWRSFIFFERYAVYIVLFYWVGFKIFLVYLSWFCLCEKEIVIWNYNLLRDLKIWWSITRYRLEQYGVALLPLFPDFYTFIIWKKKKNNWKKEEQFTY